MAVGAPTRWNFRRVIASTITANLPFENLKRHALSTNLSISSSVPNLFTQHHREKSLAPLANLLRRYGLPSTEIHSFISRNRLMLNSSEIEMSLNVLLSLMPSQEFILSVVCHCPAVLNYEFLKKWKVGFSEWRFPYVTSLLLRNVLDVSRKFGLGPNDVFKSVDHLRGLGFSSITVTKILEAYPMVIMMKEDKMHLIIGFFEGIGFKRNELDRVFCLCPQVLAFGAEVKLKRLLDEFEGLGFSMGVLRREVLREPRILALEAGELSRCLSLLSSLKCREPIKEKIFRNGPIRAAYEVKLKVDCLHTHGLIYNDAFGVLWREPRVILYKIDEIDKKIEFLVHKMNYDVQCLVDVPEYLGVNFAKQIIPRFNVIEYLRSIGGLGDPVDLKALIKTSRLKFYNLYVKPYPECEKIFQWIDVRSRHPVGMWKLFTPQKFPQSKEDVKNIRSFMENL